MTDSLVITAPGNLSDPSAATPRRLTAFPGDIAPTRRWVASQLAKLPGDTVQPWPDLTGGLTLTQATSSKQPTLERVNNIYGVLFDNSDDIMGTGTSTVSDSVFSFVVVMRAASVVSGKSFLNLNGLVLGLSGTTPKLRGTADLVTTAPAIDTGLHFIGGVCNGSSSILRVDSATATGSVGTVTATGQIATATAPNAAFAEIAYFNSALTDAQLQAIRTGLKTIYPTLP